jgi:hyperosmotically inducible protein
MSTTDSIVSFFGKAIQRCFPVLVLLLVSIPSGAQNTDSAPQAAADNSKVNQQDRQSSAATADQQKNNRSDLDVTREIRQALMKDKSLSTYAHNVKIIAQNGKVTLKGPVRSDDEREAILAKATQVAGEANVTDQLTVAPKP